MRKALAGTNCDFLLDELDADARRKPKRLPRLRRLATLLLLGLAALAAAGVPLNALYFQDGRHPAPLFRSSAPKERPAPESTQAPLPPARSQAAVPAPAQPAKPQAQAITAEPRTEKAPSDQIAALIERGSPKHDSNNQTLAAQRALIKLGYALRADGTLGSATRQAIEKFERDNGLPVTGEITQKLLRRLQARAGTAGE